MILWFWKTQKYIEENKVTPDQKAVINLFDAHANAPEWRNIIRTKSLNHIEQALRNPSALSLVSEKIKERIGKMLDSHRTNLQAPHTINKKHVLENPTKAILNACLHNEQFLFQNSYNDIHNFRLKLRRTISMIEDEYANLDRERPRKDGSTHFSHAFETTLILITEIGVIDPEAILACLAHDFYEDVTHLSDKEKQNAMRLVLQNKEYPEYGFDTLVIPLVESLTKKPIDAYLKPEEKLELEEFMEDGKNSEADVRMEDGEGSETGALSWIEETSLKDAMNWFEQEKKNAKGEDVKYIDEKIKKLRDWEKVLKDRRNEDYFGNITSVEHIPEGLTDEQKKKFMYLKIVIKFADRIHALTHMDMSEDQMPLKKQKDMIARKIAETEKYFVPQLEGLIVRYDRPEYKQIQKLLENAIQQAKDILVYKYWPQT